jgi:hypothetical protein
VPQAIIPNEATPLGLTLMPHECGATSAWFLLDLQTFNAESRKLKHCCVLSDDEQAIQTISMRLSLPYFFYYRNFIEGVGASGHLGI